MIASAFGNPWVKRRGDRGLVAVGGPLGALSCALLIGMASNPVAAATVGIRLLPPPELTPSAAVTLKAVSRPATAPSPAMGGHWYQIIPGATLWAVQQATEVPVETLERANQLPTSEIYAGNALWVPRRITAPAGADWKRLATALGVDEAALRILNPGALTPGRVLWVPPKASPSDPAALAPVPTGDATPGPSPSVAGTAVYAAAAVASEHVPTAEESASVHLDSADLLLLAHLVQAEAGDQPFLGQVAVAAVVLNRLKTPGFPKTLAGVIEEPGQFQSVANGTISLPPAPSAIAAASVAARGIDPTDGALYYYNPALTQNQWIRTQPVVVRIADQVFAR